MDTRFDTECDYVDATVFNGDALWYEENREEFRIYLERWSDELDRMEEVVKDYDSKEKELVNES